MTNNLFTAIASGSTPAVPTAPTTWSAPS